MNPIRFEVNWHSINDEFSHCTVTPITVIREGVLPGCTGVSITALDDQGRRFQGSPSDYFETEKAAWDHVREVIREDIERTENEIENLKAHVASQFNYLMKLETKP